MISIESYYELIYGLRNECQLIAVSKYHPVEKIKLLHSFGHRAFGENKVQELELKANDLKSLDIHWHFIGSLQSNKVAKLLKVPNLVSIHSIDSIKLLNKLLGHKLDKKIKLFLQVNTSEEEEKSGFSSFSELQKAIELLVESNHPNFKFQGLMSIGKIRTDDFEADARKCFQKLVDYKKQVEENFSLPCELSMGMSSDYKIAQEYGTNWIRIGTNIFGDRKSV